MAGAGGLVRGHELGQSRTRDERTLYMQNPGTALSVAGTQSRRDLRCHVRRHVKLSQPANMHVSIAPVPRD
ncbi:hypothetical protein FA13DRAFT_1739520, partial [Coprinellus micaceus]